jgi:hypothetical protein
MSGENEHRGGTGYEVDSGICARVRYRSGLPFGQDSISGAKRASRLAAGVCNERGLHRDRARARATDSFFP